ncbi:hypothetical protein BU25DRAFT_463854 [Macroventuria anomochaeta]|uniref:Uncharacterized protein n=1 Tax=Macroventuria anomochaeta TaxID=301207 RepID=A0ACB6RJG6_9PLEO|nr:uncharacterized protein BU25DRAFT_463854 [Macroventuria anomochaeta]KAF2621248.1 hypothetical protein BU25DRAFT_463854 [Macroventuria anomochaeta]
MTKLRREHGTARQLGAINNILKPQSPVQRSRRPAPHPEQTRDLHGGTRVDVQSGRQSQPIQHTQCQSRGTCNEKLRQSQQSNRRNQGSFHHDNERRSRSPQHAPRDRSDSPHQRVRGRQNDQRRPHSPQQEQQKVSHGAQRKGSKPVKGHQKSRTTPKATNVGANNDHSSSGKRKRSTIDDGNDAERAQATKHQVARLDVHRPKQPLCRAPTSQDNGIAKTEAITATTIVKSQRQSVSKAPIQLPSPPSSDASPECGGHTKEIEESGGSSQQDIVIPTPAEKIREERNLPSTMSTPPKHNEKRQRDETDSAGKAPQRLRQMKAVKPTKLQRTPSTHHPQTRAVQSEPSIAPVTPNDEPKDVKAAKVQRIPPARHHAVRPESSFAPVTPNPECDLKFLDYLHDSVPVLYSIKIKHTHSSELLNCPADKLVWDALDAIEAGFKPHSRYGWPTAIEPLGRTPSKDNPTRVLNDVDLYLHETEGKLHVATDRGLIPIMDYLKLIGVPETQPVRFDGRIPPWAKAALRARENRRVVQAWGEDQKVKKGTPLKIHQVALSLESHAEVQSERAKEAMLKVVPQANETAKAQTTSTVQDGKAKKAEDNNAPRTNKVVEATAEPKIEEEEEILEVREGDLPLPLGSIVVVYEVDQDDIWAYGRLSGTDKKGYFPISHTCPVDWSLENVAEWGARYFMDPLPESTDPKEKDWNGLAHWIRREGCPEGPTWEDTCAAAAVKAKAAKDRRLATKKANSNFNAALSRNADTRNLRGMAALGAIKMPAEQATAATELTTTTTTSTMMETTIEGAAPEVSNSGISKDSEKTKVAGSNADVREDSAQPADDVFKARIGRTILLEVEQVASGRADTGATTMSEAEERKGVNGDVAQEPEVPEPQVEKGGMDTKDVGALAPRNTFTVPHYEPFTRNDDIEYDWGDSDDER